MEVEQIKKEDGRYLIYFTFKDEAGATTPAAPESDTQAAATEAASDEQSA